MTPRIIFRSIFLFALVIGVGALIKFTPLGDTLNEAWMDEYVRDTGIRGELLFIGIGAIFTSVGLPRQAVAFMAGYVFGVAFGTGISVIAALCGCMISFFVARFLARDFVTQKFPEKFKRMDAFLAENAFTTSLLIRILPIGSNLVTSLLAGVSRVSPLPFFAGSGIGYIPQMLIFALVETPIEQVPREHCQFLPRHLKWFWQKRKWFMLMLGRCMCYRLLVEYGAAGPMIPFCPTTSCIVGTYCIKLKSASIAK